MSRYIDANKLFLHFNDWAFAVSPDERHEGTERLIHQIQYNTIMQAMGAIDEQPTADVRENRKGEWRISYVPSKDEIKIEYCSECGWGKMIEEKREYNFCQNCGADMRKGEEDG